MTSVDLASEREQLLGALRFLRPKSDGRGSISLPREMFDRVLRYLEQPLVNVVSDYYRSERDSYGVRLRDEVRGYLEELTPEQLEAAGLKSPSDVKLLRFGVDEWDNGWFFVDHPDLILAEEIEDANDENTLAWDDVFGWDIKAPRIADTGDMTDAFGPVGSGYELWIEMETGEVFDGG